MLPIVDFQAAAADAGASVSAPAPWQHCAGEQARARARVDGLITLCVFIVEIVAVPLTIISSLVVGTLSPIATPQTSAVETWLQTASWCGSLVTLRIAAHCDPQTLKRIGTKEIIFLDEF